MQATSRRNIVVTGSNKGIGYKIIEKLFAGETPYDLILTSRNTTLGEKAVKTLQEQYPKSKPTLIYHQLDITDDKSVDTFVHWLKQTFSKLDVLVNNAAIATPVTDDELKIKTVQTNFFSVIKLTEKIIPLLTENAKIVNISSTVGSLSWQGASLRKALEDENLTEEQLYDLGNNFLEVIKDFPKSNFLPEASYPGSKALLNAYIRKFLPKKLKENQQCYAICPGMCDTDMGNGFDGHVPKEVAESIATGTVGTAEDGADTPVYLINLPFEKNSELNAKFFHKRQIQSY